MREPTISRPSARRRVRRPLTSVPLRLLRRIIQDNNHAAFASVPQDELTDEERAVYEFVGEHYARHQRFPAEATLEERRIQLPEASEPLTYYRDAFLGQIRVRHGADVIMRLQEAIQADDGQAIADILMERREHTMQTTLGVVSLTDMATMFAQTLEPVNSLRSIVGTGISALDDEVGGLRRGDLGVLAARPAVGKTFLQMAGAMQLAMRGERVVVLTKEMSEEQYVHRLLCVHYDLDPSLGVQRRVSTMAYNEVIARMRDNLPPRLLTNLIIPNAREIRTTADVRAVITQHEPDMAALDGTYFLRAAERRNNPSERERLEQLVRELREVAYETRTATWVTWQQNRSKVVGTEGIYGTDALSQDAALVVMLRRVKGAPDMRVAHVTKNRHGPEDVEIGLSYKFKPSNIGSRVPVPSRETTVRQGRDRLIQSATPGQAAPRQPRRVEIPE